MLSRLFTAVLLAVRGSPALNVAVDKAQITNPSATDGFGGFALQSPRERCQSVIPYAGKMLKTFEEKTLRQRHATFAERTAVVAKSRRYLCAGTKRVFLPGDTGGASLPTRPRGEVVLSEDILDYYVLTLTRAASSHHNTSKPSSGEAEVESSPFGVPALDLSASSRFISAMP